MKKLGKVIDLIEKFAPPALAQFDYVGLLQGEMSQKISKIGLTLDYSLQAVKMAVKKDCDLLITHHGPTEISYPLFGNSLNKISYAKLHDLSMYRCHLNLDFCEGGVIDSLCELLKIPAKKTNLKYKGEDIYGGVNIIDNFPLTLDSLLELIREINPNSIRVAGKIKQTFSKIAVTSGAGFIGEFFDQLKPEVYIAGEFEQEAIKHAEDLGIMLIELTHHASEARPLDLVGKNLSEKIKIPVVRIEIPDTIKLI